MSSTLVSSEEVISPNIPFQFIWRKYDHHWETYIEWLLFVAFHVNASIVIGRIRKDRDKKHFYWACAYVNGDAIDDNGTTETLEDAKDKVINCFDRKLHTIRDKT